MTKRSSLVRDEPGNQANTRHSPNGASMLARGLRRRLNIETTLGQRLVFAVNIGRCECVCGGGGAGSRGRFLHEHFFREIS